MTLLQVIKRISREGFADTVSEPTASADALKGTIAASIGGTNHHQAATHKIANLGYFHQ